jgi:hypothetical protein
MMATAKRDQFLASRHGVFRFYNITCRCCATTLCLYQKDGFGSLRRLYLDRVMMDTSAQELSPNFIQEFAAQEFATDKKLICQGCGLLLGLGYLYQRENRPAIALFQDAIVKRPVSVLHNARALLRYGVLGWVKRKF